MKKLALAVVLPLAVILAGCSAISSGTITGKEAEPGHYYTTQTCTPVGKVTVCTPHTYYDDPDWRFDITEGKDSGWVYVTEETYGAYEVGDYWRNPEKR